MIRSVFRMRSLRSLHQYLPKARAYGATAALAVLLGAGCASGPAPDEIPDVQPLDGIAAVMSAGSISTVPDNRPVPPPTSAHAPVLPSARQTGQAEQAEQAGQADPVSPQNQVAQAQAQVAPMPMQPAQPNAQPSIRNVQAVQTPPVYPPQKSPQEQHMAALELRLLDMFNELAWLKSQPAQRTTPWGTASPKVVPAPPQQPRTATAPPPATTPPLPAPSRAAQEQIDRITALERNIQAVQQELVQLRDQAPTEPSPWGTSTPSAEQIRAAASAPPPHVPLAERPETHTVAVVPTMPAQAPPAQPAPVAPPVPPVPPVPVIPIIPPPQPMTQYPVTVPLAEVANKTIPAPSREAIATPPLNTARPQTQPPTQTGQAASSRPAQVPATPAITPAPRATAPAATQTPAAQPKLQNGEQSAYQTALNAYEGKRFNEAINSFDRYLETYPNGRYAANAVYWKGEVHYSLGDYVGAIMTFKDVLGRFPQHAKAPDALLKTIMCYNKLHDKGNASLHLRILNEDYPKSEAARKAKKLGLS